MDIIPVIDLKGGTVVHARLGQRALYQPIETPLAGSSDPVDVVTGLLSVYPFTMLYVADLDAIAAASDNRTALRHLQDAFPQLKLWVDSGIGDLDTAADWLQQDLGDLVLGSESQRDASLAHHLCENRRVVLSLDFRGAEFQGPPALLTQNDAWPQRLIVMTLDRVGSHAGPDLARLRALKAAAGPRHVYAAGGVRDADDLRALAQNRIAGALIASSLHDGRITAADLRQLA